MHLDTNNNKIRRKERKRENRRKEEEIEKNCSKIMLTKKSFIILHDNVIFVSFNVDLPIFGIINGIKNATTLESSNDSISLEAHLSPSFTKPLCKQNALVRFSNVTCDNER